ncbi:hypothetical protein F5Y04DRAFT_185359 [Hypomontagnella monticulosa]|nr:hypothetical protein F5Y04DRAFT_185359 [Hypomontagnella monticulosa]
MADPTFPFMNLVLEIRRHVYRQLLSTWPEEWESQDATRQEEPPKYLAVIRPANVEVDTAILRVNRQISREATGVFLEENLFVCLSSNGFDIRRFLVPTRVPIVSMDDFTIAATSIRRFKGLVLTHTMNYHNPGPTPGGRHRNVMILHRHLPIFVKALNKGNMGFPEFTENSQHTVEIHNPFGNTACPDYLGEKNQERLLLPYRQNMHGFDNFEVVGEVLPHLAEEAAVEVNHEPLQDPAELLEFLKSENVRGDEFWSVERYTMAIETWSMACDELTRVAKGRNWSLIKEWGGVVFKKEVTEVYIQLNSTIIAHALRLLRKSVAIAPFSPWETEHQLRILSATFKARLAPQTLGTGGEYTLNNIQLAEIFHREALAHRLTWNLREAEAAINKAREHQPNDPILEEEAALIQRMYHINIRWEHFVQP